MTTKDCAESIMIDFDNFLTKVVESVAENRVLAQLNRELKEELETTQLDLKRMQNQL
eukprot:gene2736-3331_t